jgi:hypothetical protein
MSVFPKTRAAAGYAARHARGELARARATVLLARLDACEGVLPGGDGDVPAVLHGLLRDLVLAARDLAGPACLQAAGDDPGIAGSTALQATPARPARPNSTRSFPACCGPAFPAGRPARRRRPSARPRPASVHGRAAGDRGDAVRARR